MGGVEPAALPIGSFPILLPLPLEIANPMDPGLHVKQAINHINKVLAYAPYVRVGDTSLVALTPEDWQVVADALFRMDTPREVFPEAIREYRMAEDGRIIVLETADGPIHIEMG